MRLAMVAFVLLVAGCAGPSTPGSPSPTQTSTTTTSAPSQPDQLGPDTIHRVLPCDTMGSREATVGAHLVTDQAGFEREWRKACTSPGASPTPALPAVDFAKESVLIYSWGQKSNGGYRIEVLSAFPKGQDLEVQVRRVDAGSCPAPAVITYPAQAVVIARAEGKAVWTFRDETCMPDDHLRFLGCSGVWRSGVTEHKSVFMGASEYEARWQAACPEPSPPAVDFQTEMVLHYAWGQKPMTGFDVEFRSVEAEDSVKVTVRRTAPDDHCPGFTVMTYPVAFVAIKRSPAPVTWTFEDVKRPC